MRHRVNKGRKLNRSAPHRRSLLRNLLTSLIKTGRLETTLSKAMELKRLADGIFVKAKKESFSMKRKLFSLITDKETARKLLDDIVPRLKDGTGGFTRVTKLGRRLSDGAEKARIELLLGEKDENESL